MLSPVLLTGASGRMGRVIREGLRQQVEHLRLFARSAFDDLAANETCVLGDVRDLDALVEASRGVHAVVHFAGIADEAPFEQIVETNVTGVYNVYEAARRNAVRRVVYASSHHAVGMYPTDVRLGPADPVRPDTYYGVSKVFGEALARLYHDKWGVESVCMRIGTFRERPQDRRQLSTWLSHRDGIELVLRSLQAVDVGFLVVYGVSANRDAWWDYQDAAARLGWAPLDDASTFAARVDGPAPDRQGGQFAEADYRGGSWSPVTSEGATRAD